VKTKEWRDMLAQAQEAWDELEDEVECNPSRFEHPWIEARDYEPNLQVVVRYCDECGAMENYLQVKTLDRTFNVRLG
jgi:hypothetical protein